MCQNNNDLTHPPLIFDLIQIVLTFILQHNPQAFFAVKHNLCRMR